MTNTCDDAPETVSVPADTACEVARSSAASINEACQQVCGASVGHYCVLPPAYDAVSAAALDAGSGADGGAGAGALACPSEPGPVDVVCHVGPCL